MAPPEPAETPPVAMVPPEPPATLPPAWPPLAPLPEPPPPPADFRPDSSAHARPSTPATKRTATLVDVLHIVATTAIYVPTLSRRSLVQFPRGDADMDAVRAQNSEVTWTRDEGSGASGAGFEVDPDITVASLLRDITQGHWAAYRIFSNRNRMRRSGRVVEGDGLENRSASKGRQGFESLLLLQLRWKP